MMMTPPAIRWNTIVDQKTGGIEQFADCFSEITENLLTDATDKKTVERERIEVPGLITQDTVWETEKEYYVTGDVIVKVFCGTTGWAQRPRKL